MNERGLCCCRRKRKEGRKEEAGEQGVVLTTGSINRDKNGTAVMLHTYGWAAPRAGQERRTAAATHQRKIEQRDRLSWLSINIYSSFSFFPVLLLLSLSKIAHRSPLSPFPFHSAPGSRIPPHPDREGCGSGPAPPVKFVVVSVVVVADAGCLMICLPCLSPLLVLTLRHQPTPGRRRQWLLPASKTAFVRLSVRPSLI
jgi:hypothetical protein